ncbi:hypothetical protein G2W53_024613 [Senna tora]|uniref:Uncharacterized protein n=1 Tax=Senna tora TaxID=362788 RepID=A0A834TBW0_9FABA|nr:hypothetical protein G2W53_024613 [Senna tora]
MNLPELSVVASSNARMKSSPVVPSPMRHPGSALKASLQTLSKANRSRMFWRSRILWSWEARERRGSNLV